LTHKSSFSPTQKNKTNKKTTKTTKTKKTSKKTKSDKTNKTNKTNKTKTKETPQQDGDFQIGRTQDSTRDKVQGLLLSALGAPPPGAVSPIELAVRIEHAMYEMYGTGKDYSTKYRSLSFNLKDVNNPELNRALFEGRMTPEAFVTAKEEELASEELKKKREAERQYAKDATRSDWNKGKAGMTDMFRCGKCHQRKCTYYQMQTRSADEPMTTFVTCLNCNNKFKC